MSHSAHVPLSSPAGTTGGHPGSSGNGGQNSGDGNDGGTTELMRLRGSRLGIMNDNPPKTLTVGGDISGSGDFIGQSTSTGSFGNLRVAGISVPDLKIQTSSLQTRLFTEESNVVALLAVSGSFSTRITADSSSFSTRVTNLKTDSGSFSTRITTQDADSASFKRKISEANGVLENC